MMQDTSGLVGVWVPEGVDHGPDEHTGCQVTQLTNQVAMATNIYGEDPACSAVSHRAVFLRSYYTRTRGPLELWIHDFQTDLAQFIDADVSHTDLGMHAYSDGFFYFRYSTGRRELVRLDLSSLEPTVVYVLPEDHPRFVRWGALSADHRYYANVVRGEGVVFRVLVLDLKTGEERCVAEGEDLCNAHVAFDRVDGQYLFVQQNRGQRIGANGRIESVGPHTTPTFFIVHREGGERIELPIAEPHFRGGITGHEAWLKGRLEIVYSAYGPDTRGPDGKQVCNLYVCGIDGSPPRPIVADPIHHGHVSSSECGRFWVNDRYDPEGLWIAVGSIRTGRWRNLCRVGGRILRDEIGHAHPYMTPDRKRALFVSTRTGTPQVFAVHIPDGWLDELDAEA